MTQAIKVYSWARAEPGIRERKSVQEMKCTAYVGGSDGFCEGL